MTIGNRIKKVKGRLSRGEFASKIGADKSTIQRYEQYNNIPKGDILQRMHTEFSVDINWLLTGEGQPYGNEKEEDLPLVKEARAEYADPMIKAIAGLKEIFDSRNAVLVQALTLNIAAFQMAAKNETKTLDQERRIAALENRLERLTEQIRDLRSSINAAEAAAATGSTKT